MSYTHALLAMVILAAVAVVLMFWMIAFVQQEAAQRRKEHQSILERLRRNHFLRLESEAQVYAKLETIIHAAIFDELKQYSLEHKRRHTKGGIGPGMPQGGRHV